MSGRFFQILWPSQNIWTLPQVNFPANNLNFHSGSNIWWNKLGEPLSFIHSASLLLHFIRCQIPLSNVFYEWFLSVLTLSWIMFIVLNIYDFSVHHHNEEKIENQLREYNCSGSMAFSDPKMDFPKLRWVTKSNLIANA